MIVDIDQFHFCLVQQAKAVKSATMLLIVLEEDIYDSATMIMMYLASVKNAKLLQ